jgi:hypothetical protein
MLREALRPFTARLRPEASPASSARAAGHRHRGHHTAHRRAGQDAANRIVTQAGEQAMGLTMAGNRQWAILITARPLVLVAGVGMTNQTDHRGPPERRSLPKATAALRDTLKLARLPEPPEPAQEKPTIVARGGSLQHGRSVHRYRRWCPGTASRAVGVPDGDSLVNSRRSGSLVRCGRISSPLALQYGIKAIGERLIVLFEGRDAAGKGRHQALHRAPEPTRGHGSWPWRSRTSASVAGGRAAGATRRQGAPQPTSRASRGRSRAVGRRDLAWPVAGRLIAAVPAHARSRRRSRARYRSSCR